MGGVHRMRLVLGLVALVAHASASSNSAWYDFVSYEAPAAMPEGHVQAANFASARRAVGMGNPGAYSGTAVIQATGVPANIKNTVTTNSFITGSTTTAAATKLRIAALCKAGAAGTDFARTAAAANLIDATNADNIPSQCMYCLAKGWGTTEATPGFYLPCGCQRTCVDVSGFTKGSYAAAGSSPNPSAKYSDSTTGSPLSTCKDYLDNQLVMSCANTATYHIVLWPSLLGTIILLYVAYSMAYMSLDMDSLLYEPEDNKKAD